MLKKEQNDLVTQTAPGSAMGNLFRRFWLRTLVRGVARSRLCTCEAGVDVRKALGL